MMSLTIVLFFLFFEGQELDYFIGLRLFPDIQDGVDPASFFRHLADNSVGADARIASGLSFVYFKKFQEGLFYLFLVFPF